MRLRITPAPIPFQPGPTRCGGNRFDLRQSLVGGMRVWCMSDDVIIEDEGEDGDVLEGIKFSREGGCRGVRIQFTCLLIKSVR